MSADDRHRWDERYRAAEASSPGVEPAWPSTFSGHEALLPSEGLALDVACGHGATTLWLAARGLAATGMDVSRVAIESARRRAADLAITGATFSVVDLDAGLPPSDPVDLIVCHLFRDARLDSAMLERLAPEGILAIAALSEVDAEPGPFRVAAGELVAAFDADLDLITSGEGNGVAWLIGRRPPS